MFYPDMTPLNPRDPSMLAVGWLDPQQEFSTGQFPPELLDILRGLPTTRQTRGFHRCPYCDPDGRKRLGEAHTSSNEIHVRDGDRTFCAPRMIIHYISDHGYCPPRDFTDALRNMGVIDGVDVSGSDAPSCVDGQQVDGQQVDGQQVEEAYGRVVARIDAGDVTVDDFNCLIEATDKSTRERLYRRTRQDNCEPGEHSMIGRVVPKKTGRNDPPSQGRGRRYASGSPAKRLQNAKQSRDKGGDGVVEGSDFTAHIAAALQTLIKNKMTAPNDVIAGIPDLDIVKHIRASASALLRSPEVLMTIGESMGESMGDSVGWGDWLYSVVVAADDRLLAEGERPEDVRPVRLLAGVRTHGRGQKIGSGRPVTEKKQKEEETRKYKVSGKPDQLDNLEKLLKWIEYCGNVGHSGTAEISVDGDGAAHLRFDGVSAELPEVTDGRGPEVKVGIV